MDRNSKNLMVWLVKITPARALGLGMLAFISLFLTFTMGIMTGKNMSATMPENNMSASIRNEVRPIPTDNVQQDIEIPDPRELSFYETLSKKKSDTFKIQEKEKIKKQVLSEHEKIIKKAPAKQEIATVKQTITQKDAGYTVQILSLKSESAAHIFMKKLKEKGFDSKISSITISKTHWYRVSSGEFDNIQDAEKSAFAIKSQIKGVNPIVVNMK